MQAQIFVATLGASNYTYACATKGQTKADWLSGIEQAFWYFGGVPVMVVPDNPKALVDKADNYEPVLNRTVQDFARHYGIVVLPARIRKPQDKAKVEVGVQIVQRWILARLRRCRFFRLEELNLEIARLLKDLNNRPFKKLPGSRQEAFDRLDAPYLKPLPAKRYEMAEFKVARVNVDYHIEYAGHYYSVPNALVRQQVDLRITHTAVEIYAKNKRVAIHAKSDRVGAHSTIAEHMPASHRAHQEWTPSKFIAWGHRIGTYTAEMVEQILIRKLHPEQGYRSCLGLMSLCKKYGKERLEAACRQAVSNRIYTGRSVKSILETGVDKLPERDEPPTLKLPEHDNVRGSGYYH
jgi:transposase